ncbi:MAG: YitT family protein [Clostridia bacterium]|nr:YitT family protein [Clostridia bacterium]
MTRNKKLWKTIKKYSFLFIGAVIASIGLEIFLVPNNIIDGGIVGISIISSYLSKIPLGALLFVLNIPFLFIGYKQIGKTFVISTLFSVTVLSIGVTILHPVPGLTKDVLLAAVFGGISIGLGVGLIIRYGGSLDGTEIIAIILDKKTGFSVGEIVLFFNIFILSSAGLVFGWDKAMYSVVTRLEISKLKTIISEIDENAFVTFNDVHEVMGGRFKKKAIH